jgi:hypothetical protein
MARGFGGVKLVGYRGKRISWGHHRLGVAAVI